MRIFTFMRPLYRKSASTSKLRPYTFHLLPSTIYLPPYTVYLTPNAEYRKPNAKVFHPVSSLQYPVSSLQYPVSSIQYPASSIQHPVSSIPLKYRIKPAFFETGHALNALFFIDPGNLFLFPDNRIGRTAPKTKPAFGAHIRLDFKL